MSRRASGADRRSGVGGDSKDGELSRASLSSGGKSSAENARDGRPSLSAAEPSSSKDGKSLVRQKKTPNAVAALAKTPAEMVAARAVDPGAAKEHLARKREVLLDGLEGLTVTVDGVGKRAGQSIEGVLLPDKDRLRVKASQHGRALTLVAFVGEAGHRVASEQEAKELVFVPAEKKETLAEHETTMSGYGRLKMVDGTPCWVEFDAGDWYKGKVTGFDAASAKYTISFPDGEQVSSRHALFEPEGFFLDTGKDCGMQFAGLVVGGGTPLAGTPAASPLRPGKRGGNDSKGDVSNAPKRRWVAPSKTEKSAGAQLVGRAIRVLWAFDELYHEATVTSYDPNPSTRDSRGNKGPVHFLKYDTGEFPENLQTCDWELDANEGGKDASRATKSAGAARALDIKGASGDSKSSAESGSRLADRAAAPVQDPRKSKEGKSSRDSKGQHASGSAGKTGADAVGAEAASGKPNAGERRKPRWTAVDGPHKAGGRWAVGRRVRVYWEDDREWFEGEVRAFDDSADAVDSHGTRGPAHEVIYADGPFWESLSGARWQVDAVQGPPGQPALQRASAGAVDSSPARPLPAAVGGRVKQQAVPKAGAEKRKEETNTAKEGRSTEKGRGRDDDGLRAKRAAQEAEEDGARRKKARGSDAGERDVSRESASEKKSKHEEGKAHARGGGSKDASKGKSKPEEGATKKNVAAASKSKKVAEASAPSVKRQWVTPRGAEIEGGPWLVKRTVRVYWEAESQWFEAQVNSFDGSARAVDSHGNVGPVHALEYEDGEYFENLSSGKWQYDALEGAPVLKLRVGAKGAKSADRRGPGHGAELEGWDKECEKLLGRLWRQEKAWPFLEPVDPEALGLPDYFNIIETPMDLSTVKAGLEAGRYSNPAHVLYDVQLTFHNALVYNPESDMVHKFALAMLPILESLVSGSAILRQVKRAELPPVPRQTSEPAKKEKAPASPITASRAKPSAEEKDRKSTGKAEDRRASTKGDDRKASKTKEDAPASKADSARKDASSGREAKAKVAAAAATPPASPQKKRKAEPEEGNSKRARPGKGKGRQSSGGDRPFIKIVEEGRRWVTPQGQWKFGGEWLVGRHVRLYWDEEEAWFAGVVAHYDDSRKAVDSHGHKGPVHDVYYADGSYLENLSSARWQYDGTEGKAGVPREIDALDEAEEEPAAAQRGKKAGKGKAESGAPHVDKHQEEPESPSKGRSRRESAKVSDAKEAEKRQPPAAKPKPKAESMRGFREEIGASWTGEEGEGQPFLEFEVVYADGTTEWVTGLKSEANAFRSLLLAFAGAAFPDRMFLHPWMPDFKDAVWHWGYKEHGMEEEEPKGDHGFAKINGVSLDRHHLTYRAVLASSGKEKWIKVDKRTSHAVHRLASSFLFRTCGMISIYMGRNKHAKYLRHLGAYDEFALGWEAAANGLPERERKAEDIEDVVVTAEGKEQGAADDCGDDRMDADGGDVIDAEMKEADDAAERKDADDAQEGGEGEPPTKDPPKDGAGDPVPEKDLDGANSEGDEPIDEKQNDEVGGKDGGEGGDDGADDEQPDEHQEGEDAASDNDDGKSSGADQKEDSDAAVSDKKEDDEQEEVHGVDGPGESPAAENEAENMDANVGEDQVEKAECGQDEGVEDGDATDPSDEMAAGGEMAGADDSQEKAGKEDSGERENTVGDTDAMDLDSGREISAE